LQASSTCASHALGVRRLRSGWVCLASWYKRKLISRDLLSTVRTHEKSCSSGSRLRRKLSGTTGPRLLQRPRMWSGRLTQFASQTGAGTTRLFVCSNATLARIGIRGQHHQLREAFECWGIATAGLAALAAATKHHTHTASADVMGTWRKMGASAARIGATLRQLNPERRRLGHALRKWRNNASLQVSSLKQNFRGLLIYMCICIWLCMYI